jgi:hypothetical protein
MVLPYAARVMRISMSRVYREAVFPAVLPAVLMAVSLVLGTHAMPPASLFAIVLLGMVSVLVYLASYLAFGADAAEKRSCRQLATAALQLVTGAIRRS